MYPYSIINYFSLYYNKTPQYKDDIRPDDVSCNIIIIILCTFTAHLQIQLNLFSSTIVSFKSCIFYINRMFL